MTSYAGAARHLLVLTAMLASRANNSSTSFVAAAAESDPTLLGSNDVVGWHHELNWDELESKLSPLAALIDTSFTDFKKQAKCMVSLTTMFVLSEYLTSEYVQHSSGKLRVRGVQIRGLLGNVLNRGEMKCV